MSMLGMARIASSVTTNDESPALLALLLTRFRPAGHILSVKRLRTLPPPWLFTLGAPPVLFRGHDTIPVSLSMATDSTDLSIGVITATESSEVEAELM